MTLWLSADDAPVARQSEHVLGDEVALDVGGAAVDRRALREPVRPLERRRPSTAPSSPSGISAAGPTSSTSSATSRTNRSDATTRRYGLRRELRDRAVERDAREPRADGGIVDARGSRRARTAVARPAFGRRRARRCNTPSQPRRGVDRLAELGGRGDRVRGRRPIAHAVFGGERARRDRPALVDGAEAVVVGHAGVVEEHEVGPLAAERADALDLDTRTVERHEEHRDPLVLRDLGVGAGGEHHELAEVRAGREHLLAGDAPLVAVAHGTRADGGGVGSAVGLGVPEARLDRVPACTPSAISARSASLPNWRTTCITSECDPVTGNNGPTRSACSDANDRRAHGVERVARRTVGEPRFEPPARRERALVLGHEAVALVTLARERRRR